MKKNVVVLGANGLVGHHVIDLLANSNYNIIGIAKTDEQLFPKNILIQICNLNESNKLLSILDKFQPICVINCAAMTNVDLCETEQQIAINLNTNLPILLGQWCEKQHAHLIHISTDYIYDGENGPYYEESLTNPLNFYGKTKLDGDLGIINLMNLNYTIFRAIVVFGYHRNKSKLNFVTWLIDQLKSNKSVNIVTDQIGNYTYVHDLSRSIVNAINNYFGVYNIANNTYLSRYDFSVKIAEVLNLDKNLILPVDTKFLNQKARRPYKSGLKTNKAYENMYFIPTDFETSLLEINKQLSSQDV